MNSLRWGSKHIKKFHSKFIHTFLLSLPLLVHCYSPPKLFLFVSLPPLCEYRLPFSAVRPGARTRYLVVVVFVTNMSTHTHTREKILCYVWKRCICSPLFYFILLPNKLDERQRLQKKGDTYSSLFPLACTMFALVQLLVCFIFGSFPPANKQQTPRLAPPPTPSSPSKVPHPSQQRSQPLTKEGNWKVEWIEERKDESFSIAFLLPFERLLSVTTAIERCFSIGTATPPCRFPPVTKLSYVPKMEKKMPSVNKPVVAQQ